MAKKDNLFQLHFIFTESDFIIDSTVSLETQTNDFFQSFQENKYKALYDLGFIHDIKHLSASLFYLYKISEAYFNNLSKQPELEIARENIEISINEDTYQNLLQTVPFVLGNEYVNKEWLKNIFENLNLIFREEIKNYKGKVQLYLAEKSQDLKVVHRIYFHLVEYDDEQYPFAFLATYATKENNHIRHMPLKHALEEFKDDRMTLLSLLSCLDKVAEVSPLISHFMEQGEMFHPIKLTAKEAYDLLISIPQIESCHIKCRVPNWWKKKNSSVSLRMSIGDEKPSLLGFDSLLEMHGQLAINGSLLSEEEIQQLLDCEEGLVWLKGQWVEVNHQRLEELLKQLQHFDRHVTLKEAIAMQTQTEEIDADNYVMYTNGEWLGELIGHLKRPNTLESQELPNQFNASLRTYQEKGYSWLNYMQQLGFGACLADDMGLGKTVQVLAFLERMMEKDASSRALLVVPASLLGNWSKEIEKFTPQLTYQVLHGKSPRQLNEILKENQTFLTITTYGMVSKLEPIFENVWDCLILDEAQAIKNPLTKQTRTIKTILAHMKIAMTGTPIENELSNLWSLFDFLNKGLLGTSQEFKQFSKTIQMNPQHIMKLRNMVSPFILRRLKTDKTIISDLPDKIEIIDYVKLTKKQQALYQKVMEDVIEKIKTLDGMERRGLILSTLTKLKQICNHPDQYLHQSDYLPKESGKFEMLKELCETIYEKREKVLVFTQYKEICDDLANYLQEIFHKEGFVLHGGTPVKKRNEIVEKFNSEDYYPFIVLSVKAAGTGLNLTAANHVIHFDRWWNPAVENQASDRAFRIGQKKNVFVHKLVTEGSVEEKIDALINSKKALADEVISTDTKWITEMSNDELLTILTLDGDKYE